MCFKNLRFRIPELEVAIRKLIHHSVGTHLFEVTKLFYGIHIAPVNRSDTSFTVHGNAIGSVVCKDILPLSNMVLLQNMMEANAMIFDKFAVNKFSFYRFDDFPLNISAYKDCKQVGEILWYEFTIYRESIIVSSSVTLIANFPYLISNRSVRRAMVFLTSGVEMLICAIR